MSNRLTRVRPGGQAAETTAATAPPEPTTGEQTVPDPYAAQRAFLADLNSRGITVELAPGGALHVRPKSSVSAEDRERLVAGKAEVVAALKADVEVIPPPPKQPRKVKLVGGRRDRKPRHLGEPRPTLSRPFSDNGMAVLRQRQMDWIRDRERGRSSLADMVAAAREQLRR